MELKELIRTTLHTRSIEVLMDMLDKHNESENLTRMCRCIGMSRIVQDELYKQENDPETGEPYETALAYFTNTTVAKRLGIPADRKKRLKLMVQGNALIDACSRGVIDLQTFNPVGKWEHLRYWKAAITQHGDAELVFETMMESSSDDFIDFAHGRMVSRRIETTPNRVLQEYYLGVRGAYGVVHA